MGSGGTKRGGRRLRVALAYQTVLPHLERVTAGVLEYARRHGGWTFAYSPEASLVTLESLARWDGDGVLTTIERPQDLARVRRLRCPVVNLSGAFATPRVVTVRSDNAQIGRQAAEHFLERGFGRFAYYGLRGVLYSQERQAGFAAGLSAAGCGCAVLEAESSLYAAQPWQWNRRELARWLQRLRPPVALFAVHDYRARMALEVCAAVGLRVPQDVAILGVNDDPVACGTAAPALSSIPQDGLEIGRRAAERLHALMRGAVASPGTAGERSDGPELERVRPGTVVARASTEASGIEDARLRAALAYIQQHLARAFSIDAVAAAAELSRRRLEQLFRQRLRCAPHQYVTRLRVQAAQERLAREPGIKLHTLAHASGFSAVRRMNAAFRVLLGQTPQAMRRGAKNAPQAS